MRPRGDRASEGRLNGAKGQRKGLGCRLIAEVAPALWLPFIN